MNEPRRSQREFWLVLAAGSSLMLLTGAGAYWIKANAGRPQLTLEMAVDDDAPLLPPAHASAAGDAVGGLLDSLPPDLALDICAHLTGDLARMAKPPCDELRDIAAIAPAASPVPLGSAMAALPEEVVTTPRLPADPVSAPDTTAPPEPAPPIQATLAHREPLADVTVTQVAPEPAPAVVLEVAPAGAPPTTPQTTEQPTAASAQGEIGRSVAAPAEGTEVPPTAAAPGETLAYWLFLAGMPEDNSSNADGPGEDTAAEDDASLAAEAAAKARAEAEAKAKAKAAKAAATRAKSLTGFKAERESGSPASPGKGKDRDSGGAGSSGSNADSGGGGGNKN